MATPLSAQTNHQAMQQPSQAHQPQHAGLTAPGVSGEGVKMVAGYALQQRLGSGSFATVYKGVKVVGAHGETETAAIKAIARSSEKLTKKVLENLEVEISILRTYRHPNIVCLHDVQKTERHFYLILEYCGGGDLQRLIRTRRTGRLTERLCRRLVRDLAAGLKFLWGQEFIHRDIKPQNLLLTGPLPLDELHDPSKIEADEEARRAVDFPTSKFALKIADFGFARHLQTASLAETLCGSPLYMAPEILQHHRYDAKADLWSVGTVLFEMISGRPPFNGENHIDLLRNIQRKAVRLPPDVRVSKECVNLLRLLLNRNPLSRAGFKEFFKASDAFVALGCEGEPLLQHQDQIRIDQPGLNLGPISEAGETSAQGAASMATVATVATMHRPHAQPPPTVSANIPVATPQQSGMVVNPQPISGRDSERNTPSSSPPGSGAIGNSTQPHVSQGPQPMNLVSPPLGPANIPSLPSTHTNPNEGQPQQLVNVSKRNSHFTPLEPSPPGATTYNRATPPPPLNLGAVGGMAYVPPQPYVHPQTHTIISQQGQLQGRMVVPYHLAQREHQYQAHPNQQKSDSSHSSDDSGFVMVEHSGALTPTTSQMERTHNNMEQQQSSQQQALSQVWKQANPNQMYRNRKVRQPLQSHSPPASPKYFNPVAPGRRESGFSNLTRGMLSTSPGTGGMLVGMMGKLTGGGSAPSGGSQFQNRFDTIGNPRPGGRSDIGLATKMLAAAEDVGRRAVAVAHLGDTRAFFAMRLMMANEGSSLLSSSPMEGVVEEDDESSSSGVPDSDGTSSSSTRVAGRMRAVSADKSMENHASRKQVDDEGEDDEMPFAISPAPETDPSFSLAPVPARPSVSTVTVSSSSLASCRSKVRAPPSVIQAHFREALTCYLKALSMIKSAVSAAQRVLNELGSSMLVRPADGDALLSLRKRCEVSQEWLSGQFAGVLERADASNGEIAKLQLSTAQETGEGGEAAQNSAPVPEKIPLPTVEELIYNHSLTCGRDGAVKQLLGQLDAARSCYRSAGLLAETLLMEPRMGEDDRKVLEEYVHGFAERITELDSTMMQQSRHSGGGSSSGGSVGGSRRSSGIIGLVGGVPLPNQPLLS